MSKGQICGICKSIYVEYCIIRLPANWKRQKYFEFGMFGKCLFWMPEYI